MTKRKGENDVTQMQSFYPDAKLDLFAFIFKTTGKEKKLYDNNFLKIPLKVIFRDVAKKFPFTSTCRVAWRRYFQNEEKYLFSFDGLERKHPVCLLSPFTLHGILNHWLPFSYCFLKAQMWNKFLRRFGDLKAQSSINLHLEVPFQQNFFSQRETLISTKLTNPRYPSKLNGRGMAGEQSEESYSALLLQSKAS